MDTIDSISRIDPSLSQTGKRPDRLRPERRKKNDDDTGHDDDRDQPRGQEGKSVFLDLIG